LLLGVMVALLFVVIIPSAIMLADHARMWYVHLNYNLLCHTTHLGAYTNLYLFNWRYNFCSTYVTAVGHCMQSILYLFTEDTPVVDDFMRILWIAQPLITKLCFSHSQHISIVVETTNPQWA
jgi:hypothetical protein